MFAYFLQSIVGITIKVGDSIMGKHGLQIGGLSPEQIKQLNTIVKTAKCLTGKRISLLDPNLFEKLRETLSKVGAKDLVTQLDRLAESATPTKFIKRTSYLDAVDIAV